MFRPEIVMTTRNLAAEFSMMSTARSCVTAGTELFQFALDGARFINR